MAEEEDKDTLSGGGVEAARSGWRVERGPALGAEGVRGGGAVCPVAPRLCAKRVYLCVCVHCGRACTDGYVLRGAV